MMVEFYADGEPEQTRKSARKPRQCKAGYRCCIPALAGLACRQSMAPGKAESSRIPFPAQLFFRRCQNGGRKLGSPSMKAIFLTILATAALLLSGCAIFNQWNSSSDEQLLNAAGFQTRPVTTPQQAAVLASLTPYQVTMRTRGNQVYYIYGDPKRNIVLVGGQAQYDQFQKLQVQQGIAEDQLATASEMTMLASDESAMWDPFWD